MTAAIRAQLSLLFAVALLAATSGCASDRCESEPPSFQLDLRLGDLRLAASVDAIDVELRLLGRSYSRWFSVGGTFGDGVTSLSVELDPAPTENIELTIVANALVNEETRASGLQVFRMEPNGCNRFELVLSPGNEPVDGGPSDQSVDASDAGGSDATELDSGPDAGIPDQGELPPDPPCTTRVDDGVVLLYTFDEVPAFTTTVADAREAHPAFAAPPGSVVDRGPSREECGLAARFSGSGYLEVPHADEFELTEGSLDFWFSASSVADVGMQGIVSRDASGTSMPGHLGIYRDCQGYIFVRMQRGSTPDIYRCSNEPVGPDAWVHIGLNFGAPEVELYVDGALSTNTSSTSVLWNCDSPVPCGASATYGIDGNQNPFVLGAGTHVSEEGAATPISTPLVGAIDSFRLSRIRRSF